MNDHRRRQHHGSNGLPMWLNVTVVLNLLGLFSYNVLFVGEKSYPTNVLIAGLLGGYIGVEQLIRRRNDRTPPPDPPPGGDAP